MRISPTLRLSISAALMTASLVLVADLIGLFPNTHLATLEARQRICESLAVTLSVAATRSDADLVKQTLDVFVARSPDVLSAAIRRAQGDIFSQSPDHAKHWKPLENDHSTFTHVLVPVFAGNERWGAIEVSFTPTPQKSPLAWLTSTVWGMALFTGLFGLGAFYLILRRALHELDPRGTVPQRIKSAFDALAEGVLILDHRGFIALANAAFAKKSGRKADALMGMNAAQLEWRDADGESKPENLPWAQTLSEGATRTRVVLQLATNNGREALVFVANSAPILDDRQRPRGAIVTFDDVTAVEKKNQELKTAIELLEESEREIKRKNEDLFRLASRDSLTGCLNRRAFFGAFGPLFAKVETESMVLSCLMLDIDFFKTVNDRFGHDVGDKVLKWVAETIQSQIDDNGLVCRYGGEEFCVVLPGLGVFQANAVAQQIRRAIEENASIRFGRDLQVTISIGLSSVHFGAKTVANLIQQADQALYAAKANGRNCVVRWSADIAPQELPSTVRRHLRANEIEGESDHAAAPAPALADRLRPADNGNNRTAQPRLAERVEFAEWIEQAVRESKSEAEKVAVLSLVPNQFRRVSDTLGATIGDALLVVVSQRLHEQLRGFDAQAASGEGKPRALVSRLGIDELGIALMGVTGKESVQKVVGKVLRALAHPMEVHGHIVNIDVSIGVALTPEGGSVPEELLKNAAAARHFIQEENRSEHCAFYSYEMGANAVRRTRIVSELQQALSNNQFVLHYQSQQDLQTGQIVAWEALLRWAHPELGFVLPSELIPLAEQTGLIHSLGKWVLRAACMQAKAWSDAGLGAPRIAVNLSAVQLQHSDIVAQVRDVLAETGLAPNRLELEVTEGAIMHDQALAQRTLQQLRKIGLRIAIDDFGTGYSGLSYIKDFPVDVVKIDRSFITDVLADARSSKLYSAIVEMARSLNLYVIAEGVEMQDEFEFVNRSGCNAIQGYLFGPPMLAEQVERVMRDGHTPAAHAVMRDGSGHVPADGATPH